MESSSLFLEAVKAAKSNTSPFVTLTKNLALKNRAEVTIMKTLLATVVVISVLAFSSLTLADDSPEKNININKSHEIMKLAQGNCEYSDCVDKCAREFQACLDRKNTSTACGFEHERCATECNKCD